MKDIKNKERILNFFEFNENRISVKKDLSSARKVEELKQFLWENSELKYAILLGEINSEKPLDLQKTIEKWMKRMEKKLDLNDLNAFNGFEIFGDKYNIFDLESKKYSFSIFLIRSLIDALDDYVYLGENLPQGNLNIQISFSSTLDRILNDLPSVNR